MEAILEKRWEHAVTWESVHDGGRSGDKPFRTQIGPGIPPADHAESGPRAPIKAQRGDDPAVENQYIGVMLTC